MRSALALAAAIRAGETSARTEVEAAITRIEAGDAAINSVVVRDFDRARIAADAADARVKAGETAPLLGVPMTVKESFDVAGLPTSWGFTEHRDFVPGKDAVAVLRLKRAGAIILGKTNVPVGLADLQAVNPIYGRTNNPLDPSLVPGGSSGGAAAALAAGFVPIEMGSDIGGSIRVPAAFCGVWGLKSSYGVLPMDGHNFPRTDGARVALSVIGPMARGADDLAAMLDIVADIAMPPAPVDRTEALRVLLLTHHPLAPADAAIVGAIEAAGTALAKAGAHVAQSSDRLPDLTRQHGNYMRMLGIAMARGTAPPGTTPATLIDWFDLLDEQARCARSWAHLFEEFDVVIAPALGSVAFPHPEDADLRSRRIAINGADEPFAMQFAWPGLATFPGLPATSVPIGRTEFGLPIGAQLIGGYRQDHMTIAAARMLHDLLGS